MVFTQLNCKQLTTDNPTSWSTFPNVLVSLEGEFLGILEEKKSNLPTGELDRRTKGRARGVSGLRRSTLSTSAGATQLRGAAAAAIALQLVVGTMLIPAHPIILHHFCPSSASCIADGRPTGNTYVYKYSICIPPTGSWVDTLYKSIKMTL